MLRVPLDELCLQIKLLDLGDVADFLGRAIEPPRVEAVTEAIKGLQDLQALDLREYLTPLGYHLASLPVNVRIGKILLYGALATNSMDLLALLMDALHILTHACNFHAQQEQS